MAKHRPRRLARRRRRDLRRPPLPTAIASGDEGASFHMVPTEISSPPRSPPLAGCAGGTRRAGAFSPSSSRSALADIHRLPVEATAAASPELPEDMVMCVFGKLEIPDLVRAGAVCTSWRSAYITLRDLGKHKQPQAPCLLYTSESAGDNVACLYSLVEKMVYMSALPEPPIRRRFIIGSSLGFLVTVDEMCEMHLLNPITGEQIELPSVVTFDQVKPVHDDSGAVHKYRYSRHSATRLFCLPQIISPATLRRSFHRRALVFSDTSTGSYIVVIIHEPHGQLSFARVGDDKWTWLPPHVDYMDCTYKDGLLYAVVATGEIHTFDLSRPAVTMNIIRGRNEDLCVEAIYILQPPWGGLLLVSRSKSYARTENHYDPPVPTTKEIKLYKVDGAERLVEIDCLPDHVLFLGHNPALCLSAKEYPALKRNHAYFTDDHQMNSLCTSSPREIGLLDLGNNSKEDLVSPQLWSNWPAPVWITPNLTRMILPLPK